MRANSALRFFRDCLFESDPDWVQELFGSRCVMSANGEDEFGRRALDQKVLKGVNLRHFSRENEFYNSH